MNSLYFLFLILFIWVYTNAQGGPRMINDDPGTVEKGHFEINFGFTTEQNSSEAVYESPLIDINYGINKRAHVNFEVPYVLKRSKETETVTGIGKPAIGMKWRFIDQDKAGIDVSTHPAISFVFSTDEVNRGIIEKGTEIFIPVEFQKDFGNNIIGMELGRLLNSRSEGAWTYGLV